MQSAVNLLPIGFMSLSLGWKQHYQFRKSPGPSSRVRAWVQQFSVLYGCGCQFSNNWQDQRGFISGYGYGLTFRHRLFDPWRPLYWTDTYLGTDHTAGLDPELDFNVATWSHTCRSLPLVHFQSVQGRIWIKHLLFMDFNFAPPCLREMSYSQVMKKWKRVSNLTSVNLQFLDKSRCSVGAFVVFIFLAAISWTGAFLPKIMVLQGLKVRNRKHSTEKTQWVLSSIGLNTALQENPNPPGRQILKQQKTRSQRVVLVRDGCVRWGIFMWCDEIWNTQQPPTRMPGCVPPPCFQVSIGL